MTSGGTLAGSESYRTDPKLRELLGALQSTPTGNNLLLGVFVEPFSINETDPRSQTNVPNGLTLLWHDGEDAFESTFYAEFVTADKAAGESYPGWRTVAKDWPETVMETRTDDPVNPETGRFWLRTDL